MNKSEVKITLLTLIFIITATLRSTATATITITDTTKNSATTINICHVSSIIDDILPSANDLKLRYSGFEMALQNFNKKQKNKFYALFHIIKPTQPTDTILDLIKKSKDLNCHAVVGLVTSRDTMLAGPFLKINGIVGISATAVHDDISKFYPQVISLSDSASSWAQAITTEFKQSDIKSVYIYIRESDVFSDILTTALEKHLRIHKIKIQRVKKYIEFDSLLKQKNKSAIVFTTYPVVSIESMIYISKINPRNITIYGNPAWMEKHTFSAVTKYMPNIDYIYLSAPWHNEYSSKQQKDFLNLYQTQYNKNPDHDTAYNYDSAMLALECITRSPQLKCNLDRYKYTGITGQFQFNDASHANRPEIIKKMSLKEKSQ
jgi:ABC-type branched-subunit amino acid transport system substrate-binding protein